MKEVTEKAKKGISGARPATGDEYYCNSCQTVHIVLDLTDLRCKKCGRLLCNCQACRSTIELIRTGKLSK